MRETLEQLVARVNASAFIPLEDYTAMAKPVKLGKGKTFTFASPKGGGQSSKYPWDEWLDGKVHRLARWVDFETSATNFVVLARSKAYTVRYPFPVSVSRTYDEVTIQAMRPLDGAPA